MSKPACMFAAAALVAASAPALAAEAGVSATHTLVKLQPGDAAEGAPVARLAAAANEVEGFQAIVAGGDAGLKRVSAALSDLAGPARIAARNATLYRAAYIDVRNASDGNARVGPTPDALVPDVDPYFREKRNAFPFDVPAGENRTIWVDVHVPPGTPAGTYEGELTLTADGGFSRRLPVELEVFPFELASTPSYASSYGLSWNATCQQHHGEVWCDGDQDRYDELRQLYGIAGLNNRMSFSKIAGRFVERDGAGGLDFSRYDEAIGPLLSGTANTILPGAKMTSIEVWQRAPRSAADYAAWAKHFRAKGWFDRLFDYTCDEPPLTCAWSDIEPAQRTIHAGDPELRSLVTTTVAHLEERGIYASTDIVVPVVNFVEGKEAPYAGDQSAAYRRAAAEGKDVWIYSSCMSHGCGGNVGGEYEDQALAGWPSLAIDHTAVRNRALPWVAYKFGFTGELYWDSAYAFVTKTDPWVDQWEFSGNGDGTLLYPGTPAKIGGTKHIPIESIRMKHIRDGIEDYEYLKTLERFDPAAAKAYADKLFPHAWSAGELDGETVHEVRREIAEAIRAHVRALGGGRDGDAPMDPSTGGEAPTAAGGEQAPGGGRCGAAGAGLAPAGGLGLVGLLGMVVRRRRR